MAKLALAVDHNTPLGFGSTAAIAIVHRVGVAAVPNIGETVLLYNPVAGLQVFVGQGRITGLEAGEGKAQLICRLDRLALFDNPVTSQAETGVPGVRRMVSLSPERFAEIVEQGTNDRARADGREVAAAFRQLSAPTPETYRAIHDEVLRRWDYRCSLTGQQFEPEGTPHPFLSVVAIRPREQGGPLHVRNFLPLSEAAARAWNEGHVAVDADSAIWLNLAKVDPEFGDTLHPLGRLLLPEDPNHRPDSEHLAFHRASVLPA